MQVSFWKEKKQIIETHLRCRSHIAFFLNYTMENKKNKIKIGILIKIF
jgi:hypothetical protein